MVGGPREGDGGTRTVFPLRVTRSAHAEMYSSRYFSQLRITFFDKSETVCGFFRTSTSASQSTVESIIDNSQQDQLSEDAMVFSILNFSLI